MGTLYIAVPSDRPTRDWLAEIDAPVPDASDGRLPTEAEIRLTLSELSGYGVRYWDDGPKCVAEISWAAEPTHGPWASLVFPKQDEIPTEKSHLGFRKGWPELIVLILHKLTKIAGPLVLIPDTGAEPLLVYSAADPTGLVGDWEG